MGAGPADIFTLERKIANLDTVIYVTPSYRKITVILGPDRNYRKSKP